MEQGHCYGWPQVLLLLSLSLSETWNPFACLRVSAPLCSAITPPESFPGHFLPLRAVQSPAGRGCHLLCSRSRIFPPGTSRRRCHGSPPDTGTPRCPGCRPGTPRSPSTTAPAARDTSHTGARSSRGSTRTSGKNEQNKLL